MNKVFYKTKEGFLAKPWKHLDSVKKGEIIAKYNDGENIIAEDDCLIILPHHREVKLGGGWFYLGNIDR
jgi:hypothetical protein